MLYGVLRRWLSPALAWLLVALFATTPMVQLVTGSLFVENLLAAMIFGAMMAIWSFGESGERRFLYAAGALGGTAIAIKVGAIAFVVPATLCAAVEMRRHRRQTGARWVFGARFCCWSPAAPPYAIAWSKTGNPLFPFLNEKYHSRLLDPEGRYPGRALSPTAHLEPALRSHLPQQPPLRRAGRILRFPVPDPGADGAAGAAGGHAAAGGGGGVRRLDRDSC